mmetsp:Transcript_30204/g.59304  ORF Transcript_30204/g.59304 Transcript_30204/m.59304 type:complete len:84 (-) Transcript_30204:1633-1884(-)
MGRSTKDQMCKRRNSGTLVSPSHVLIFCTAAWTPTDRRLGVSPADAVQVQERSEKRKTGGGGGGGEREMNEGFGKEENNGDSA